MMRELPCPKCGRNFPTNELPEHLQTCFGNLKGIVNQIAKNFQEFSKSFHKTDKELCMRCPFCDQDLPILQLNSSALIHPINFEELKRHALEVQIHHAQVYHNKTPEEVQEALKK